MCNEKIINFSIDKFIHETCTISCYCNHINSAVLQLGPSMQCYMQPMSVYKSVLEDLHAVQYQFIYSVILCKAKCIIACMHNHA